MIFAKRLWMAGMALAAGLVFWLAALHPAAAGPGEQAPTSTPGDGLTALVAVERAFVFPIPDRLAEPITYLFERERVPVLAASSGGDFLQVMAGGQPGWILRAQVDLEGDPALLDARDTLAPTATPAVTATATAPRPTPTPILLASATPRPARTDDPAPEADATPAAEESTAGAGDLPAVVPGTPPPLTITLPEDWEALDLIVPFESLAGDLAEVPLTIYFGPLPDEVNGYIYLYWGFPNVAALDGEYNLWADGVQLLRGSLIGESCTLGLYEQKLFSIGGLEAVGASYQTSDCVDETDTAGWFGVVRVYDGSFAFFTAVEPLHAIVDQRDALQAILDSVEFLPPEDE